MKVVGYMRVNSIEQLGGTQVAEKERSMVEKILDTERAGYAYFYPSDGGNRQEFFISTTPENMANFLGSHFYDAEKRIITDMVDRLILDTYGGFINTCPDQKLCAEIIPYLAPIQMGEKEAGEILMVTRIRYVLCCRGPSSHDGRVSDDVSVFLWGIILVLLKSGGAYVENTFYRVGYHIRDVYCGRNCPYKDASL